MELVDSKGCTKSSLISPHNFDIIYGLSFTDDSTDTTSQNVQFDYYYKNFSLELSTSYFNSKSSSYNDNGVNDSFVGVYYQLLPTDKLKIRSGLGMIIPTYDSELNNNNTDYTATLSASYSINDMNLFIGYNYTQVNDDDYSDTLIDVKYQDTNAFSAGIGFYPSEKLYLSTSYFISESIYKDFDSVETLSAYAYYSIDSKWFTTFNYAYGLSDNASDSYISFRVGYSF